MSRKICCILDTCALSFLIEDFKKLDNEEKERLNIFESIKNEITSFVVPSIVIHELALGLQENNDISDNYLKIIIKHFKIFFNGKLKIEPLNAISANEYRKIYMNNKIKSENKYKHKIDALIVAQASHYASMLYGKYSDFWLITEDNKMREYKANDIKIFSLQEAQRNLGLLI
ncbi:PIN domain-containing protein [Brachyspira aalborgi]|uniref:PIN domain-containing protein n=1 Tax=Brachyspira aalborgi TaxID=29522 RepID=A0A5C8GC47_9SPIR|nr:PIN domain-containing protein [Brachyspira aalborgi]TXJ59552.1 PIN domain-containing protein [Brachyspira aalborgi]